MTAPLLVVVGASDDWTPAADCRAMVEMTEGGSAPETLVVLPGARHGFNDESVRDRPRELFGRHLEYNADAAAKASAAAADFLRDLFRQ